MQRPGIEPTICPWPVQCPNHYTTEPYHMGQLITSICDTDEQNNVITYIPSTSKISPLPIQQMWQAHSNAMDFSESYLLLPTVKCDNNICHNCAMSPAGVLFITSVYSKAPKHTKLRRKWILSLGTAPGKFGTFLNLFLHKTRQSTAKFILPINQLPLNVLILWLASNVWIKDRKRSL